MALPIAGDMINEGASVYYAPAWFTMMESHMRYLRTHPDTTVLALDPHDAYKYEADLLGLLLHLHQPPEYCWIIARMNHFSSPSDFTQDTLQLLIPRREVIENLRAIFQTIYTKIN